MVINEAAPTLYHSHRVFSPPLFAEPVICCCTGGLYPCLWLDSLVKHKLIVVCSPLILGIDPTTIDMPTRGALVNFYMRNMGWGRHVAALNVGMSYHNPNNSYVAAQCRMSWNGSMVTCLAVPGVGRGHVWAMNISGVHARMDFSMI